MNIRILQGFWVLALSLLLSGCFGLFGEPVRAPVYEGDRMVARAGPKPSIDVYTVRSGDTLYSIAWRENMDYRALALWNGLRSDAVISPGQRLRLHPPQIREGYYVEPDLGQRAVVDLQPQSDAAAERDVRLAATTDNSKQELVRKAQQLQVQNGQGITRGAGLKWHKPTQGRLVKTYVPSDLTLKGVHIAGREGQPIVAAESGKVVYSGSGLKGYGNLIIVKHDNNYLSAYGYNRKILVKEGQMVRAGELIAEMGRSDKGAALLHFEIRHKGKPINPASLVAL